MQATRKSRCAACMQRVWGSLEREIWLQQHIQGVYTRGYVSDTLKVRVGRSWVSFTVEGPSKYLGAIIRRECSPAYKKHCTRKIKVACARYRRWDRTLAWIEQNVWDNPRKHTCALRNTTQDGDNGESNT